MAAGSVPPARGSSANLFQVGLLVGLGLLGLGFERLGLLDWRAGVELAQGYSGHWWVGPVVALAMAGLYAFGLPGSVLIWVAGILFPPAVATAIVVAGGLAGAVGAYSVALAAGSRGRGEEERDGDGEGGRLVRLLRRRGDLATLIALRLAPGVPHSALNFAAGVLRIPRGRFLLATGLGLTVKGWLYVTAIHQAARVAALEEAVSWRTAAPLVALSLFLLLAPLVRRALAPARGEPG